jgi:hypothetical protein
MIFVIPVLSLVGIDTKIMKIVRYNFHTSAAFRLFPAHMEGFGQKKVDIRYRHVTFSRNPN